MSSGSDRQQEEKGSELPSDREERVFACFYFLFCSTHSFNGLVVSGYPDMNIDDENYHHDDD